MKKGLQKRILGFTLVEIMIVVTIIGILASLAVPAFQRARWKALETSIRNNLRQIWGAAQQYMLENGVNSIDALEIVAWKPKTGEVTGTNAGYTSVIQQISDEDYAKIGIYIPDSESSSGDTETTKDTNSAAVGISSFTSDETKSDGSGDGNSILTADTQGLFIQAGGKYVKLRL